MLNLVKHAWLIAAVIIVAVIVYEVETKRDRDRDRDRGSGSAGEPSPDELMDQAFVDRVAAEVEATASQRAYASLKEDGYTVSRVSDANLTISKNGKLYTFSCFSGRIKMELYEGEPCKTD